MHSVFWGLSFSSVPRPCPCCEERKRRVDTFRSCSWGGELHPRGRLAVYCRAGAPLRSPWGGFLKPPALRVVGYDTTDHSSAPAQIHDAAFGFEIEQPQFYATGIIRPWRT